MPCDPGRWNWRIETQKTAMNPVRKKLLWSWSLFAVLAVLLALHHVFLAWLVVFPILLLVRQGLPRPELPPRLRVAVCCLLIGYFGWVVIKEYRSLPSTVSLAVNIIGAAGCVSLSVVAIRCDYQLFKGASPTGSEL